MGFFRGIGITVAWAALALAEDPVAALSHRMEAGEVQLAFSGPYGYLPALLGALHVPVESQMAVFSKTSIQSLRIEPANPRILFFNDSVVVGWVRGGFIEMAAEDPGNGIHFYALMQRPEERPTRREDCLNCHKGGTARLSSVMAGPDGIPARQTEVDNRTPFSGLWGGWFVTGRAAPAGGMGNTVFVNSERRQVIPALVPAVAPAPSSDVAALLVFAHQVRMMNLLAHPGDAGELADALLFADEAPLPEPARGGSGFAEVFAAQGPRDHLGRSLRETELDHRLMRYPCSYMIYTEAFDALPAALKEAVYRRMSRILTGEETAPRYSRYSRADREAVIGILRDTKKDLPAWFGEAGAEPAGR